jgi:hypothetical protein
MSTKFYKAAMEKIGTAYHLRAPSFTPPPFPPFFVWGQRCSSFLCCVFGIKTPSNKHISSILYGIYMYLACCKPLLIIEPHHTPGVFLYLNQNKSAFHKNEFFEKQLPIAAAGHGGP